MSEIATDLVWSESKSCRGSRLVLLALAREADNQGRVALTLEEISRLTGLTVRSITTCLSDLASLGELSRERGGGASNPSSYSILLVGRAGSAEAQAGPKLPTSGPGVPQTGKSFQEGASRKSPAAPSKWKPLRGEPEVTSSRARGGNTPYGSITTTQKQASFPDSNLREVPAGQDSVEVPAGSKELVAAMTGAGMVVGWRLTEAEWDRVTALAARWGRERLVEMVARRWNADRPPLSARYLLRIWADLPDQALVPAGQTNVVPLRRQPGTWVPFQNTAQPSAYQNGF
ncbi:hypothetical protein GCM10009665_06550 [Kitasatospora nipponensis]|uniref:Helix-turn-helix domain-containing protein n=1 Tax=Kitasatospora nipponensis TaxID=258049 RepID=A0ABN1VU00_9ACTN